MFLGVFICYEGCAELLNLVSILLRARIGVPLPCLPSDVLVQGAEVGMPIGAGLRCEPPHDTLLNKLSVTALRRSDTRVWPTGALQGQFLPAVHPVFRSAAEVPLSILLMADSPLSATLGMH